MVTSENFSLRIKAFLFIYYPINYLPKNHTCVGVKFKQDSLFMMHGSTYSFAQARIQRHSHIIFGAAHTHFSYAKRFLRSISQCTCRRLNRKNQCHYPRQTILLELILNYVIYRILLFAKLLLVKFQVLKRVFKLVDSLLGSDTTCGRTAKITCFQRHSSSTRH